MTGSLDGPLSVGEIIPLSVAFALVAVLMGGTGHTQGTADTLAVYRDDDFCFDWPG